MSKKEYIDLWWFLLLPLKPCVCRSESRKNHSHNKNSRNVRKFMKKSVHLWQVHAFFRKIHEGIWTFMTVSCIFYSNLVSFDQKPWKPLVTVGTVKNVHTLWWIFGNFWHFHSFSSQTFDQKPRKPLVTVETEKNYIFPQDFSEIFDFF